MSRVVLPCEMRRCSLPVLDKSRREIHRLAYIDAWICRAFSWFAGKYIGLDRQCDRLEPHEKRLAQNIWGLSCLVANRVTLVLVFYGQARCCFM